MPRPPKFTHRKTARGWCVNTPASVSASGKRERAYFPTRDAAKAHAADLRARFIEHGGNAAGIRPALAEEAHTAAELLEPWGASLLDAARHYVAHREREAASCAAHEAVSAWLESCAGLRPRSLKSYRATGEKLRGALGTRSLAAITAEDLADALGLVGASGAGAALRYRNGRAFWRWCAGKGWCDAATFNEIDAPRVSRDGEIEILKPEAVAALMATCEEHAPELCAHFALLAFAGVRAEELARLRGEHVSPAGIDLPAAVTKKGRRRHITPSPTLRAWLGKHPFEPHANWRRGFDRIRRLAGWKVQAQGLPADLPEPTRGVWPQNCLRHSHASYAVAAGTPLESLLFEFGHAGTPAVLREHYVGRSSKKQALEFFAIVPEGEATPEAISAA